MKSTLFAICLLVGQLAFSQKQYTYPIAPKDSISDQYFGESIADPYQWMENPNDARLEEWLTAQAKLQKKQANKQTNIWELRGKIASMYYGTKRMTTDAYQETDSKLLNKYVFKYKTTNNSKSPNLLYKLSDKENYRMLVRAKDFLVNRGDHVLVRSRVINEEEDLAVVKISINGSDWATGYVIDLETGEQLSDTIKYLRTGSNLVWHGKELYFDGYDPPKDGRALLDKAAGQKLYKLKVGTNSDAQMIYQNPDLSGINSFDFSIVDDRLQLYHFLQSQGNWYSAISVADLNNSSFFPRRFLVYPMADSIIMSIEHIENDSVFLYTNWNAPNGKVLLANISQPNQLSEFVPEYDINLKSVDKLGKNKIACVYMSNGQNIALIFDYQGELLKKIDFPKGKKLSGFYEYEDKAKNTLFSISSFYHPQLWYQISLSDLSFKPIETLSVPYDASKLETRYVTYPSKDGTLIPMYITCRKDTDLNGNNPVLMYGYGGYGVTVGPFFEESIGLLLLHGGVLAVPNIRGGGANGGEWAREGRKLKKQNAIDDFTAAAEYLIKENYTSSQKLVIKGGSHGGMLVGASLIQRPELFKAAVAQAGVYDMLRFHLYTAGSVNTNILEFGTPDTEADYFNLKSYSPLHNIKEGVKYPNLLLITGDSDDRVPPHHTYKFLAQLQASADPTGLYQIYITPGAGHGGGLTSEDRVAELLFKYYFIFDQLDIDF